MDDHPQLEAAKDWLVCADPQGRYILRFPHEWKVHRESADRTVVKEPGSRAEIAISYLAEDCAVAQSMLRGRRLNYCFIPQFTPSISGPEPLTPHFTHTTTT